MHRPRSVANRELPWLVWIILLLAPSIAAQEVTLPLERYDQLRALARPAPVPESEPPASVAFESAVVTVMVSGDAAGSTGARITQDLTLTILGEGWQNISLGDTGTLIEADFGTADGRVDGTVLVLRGIGRHHLRLISVVPLMVDETATRPSWRLRLGMPLAAVVHGSVATPPGIEEITGEGAIVGGSKLGGRWEFVADPGADMKLALRGPALTPEKDKLPLRFDATSGLALEVARGRRRARGWLEIEVRQGRLERLVTPIPEGFEVIDVAGDGLAGWDVDGGRVEIMPLAPITDRLSLELELAADAATDFSGPTLVPDGAASVLAASKVQVSGDGLLRLVDGGSGRQPDGQQEAELPAGFRSAPGMTLVLAAAGKLVRWQVTWAGGLEVLAAQVDRLLVDVLVGASGRAGYQLWAEVRNRGAERLVFELPAGAELIDARRDGRRIEPGLTPEGRPLDGPAAWTVPLSAGDDRQVIYLSSLLPLKLPVAGGRFDVPLPTLSAPVGRVEVNVTLPAGSRYELIDSGRRGAVGEPPVSRLAGEPDARGTVHLGAVTLRARAGRAPEFFPQPPGFRRIVAAWSALSPSPSALGIRIKDASDTRRWF